MQNRRHVPLFPAVLAIGCMLVLAGLVVWSMVAPVL